MVLPRKVDIRSNGVVGVKTFLVTYRFSDVVRVYEADMGRDDLLRPRIKFATTFSTPHRLVVERNGKWDLVITPSDPQGFIQAVERVTSKLERLAGDETNKSEEKQAVSSV